MKNSWTVFAVQEFFPTGSALSSVSEILSAVSSQHPAVSRGQRFAICGLRYTGFGAAICRQRTAASSQQPEAICNLRFAAMVQRKAGILFHANKKPGCRGSSAASNRQRPILPDRFQSSTFGVQGLNYCVRHGNRWIPLAIVTGYVVEGLSPQNFMKRHCNVSSFSRTHFSH